MWTVILGIIMAGICLYFLFGLVWNFVYCTAWVIYWVWYPIDRLVHRERRPEPRRALD